MLVGLFEILIIKINKRRSLVFLFIFYWTKSLMQVWISVYKKIACYNEMLMFWLACIHWNFLFYSFIYRLPMVSFTDDQQCLDMRKLNGVWTNVKTKTKRSVNAKWIQKTFNPTYITKYGKYINTLKPNAIC